MKALALVRTVTLDTAQCYLAGCPVLCTCVTQLFGIFIPTFLTKLEMTAGNCRQKLENQMVMFLEQPGLFCDAKSRQPLTASSG